MRDSANHQSGGILWLLLSLALVNRGYVKVLVRVALPENQSREIVLTTSWMNGNETVVMEHGTYFHQWRVLWEKSPPDITSDPTVPYRFPLFIRASSFLS